MLPLLANSNRERALIQSAPSAPARSRRHRKVCRVAGRQDQYSTILYSTGLVACVFELPVTSEGFSVERLEIHEVAVEENLLAKAYAKLLACELVPESPSEQDLEQGLCYNFPNA